MKKIIKRLFLLITFLFISLITILSTTGIETNKFNKVISDKASQTKNINLKLETVEFKINLRQFRLFLETQNPKISYRDISIPIKNIKVYIEFISLIKSDPKINKINFNLEELDIKQLNKLSLILKPSNFKSLLNNKIKEGQMASEVEIFFTDKGKIENYIAKGTLEDIKMELFSGLNLTKLNMSFFADKNDVLFKKIFGNFEDVRITDGDVKLSLENGIKVNSNFNSKIDFDEKLLSKYHKIFKKNQLFKNLRELKSDFNNTIYLDLDKTYKLKEYNYSISGIVEKGLIELLVPIKNNFITEEVKKIYFSNSKISTNFSSNDKKFKGEGKYSLNNQNFLNFKLENNFTKDLTNLNLDFEYAGSLKYDLINYRKSKDTTANFFLNLEKKENKLKIKKLDIKKKK